EARDFDTVDRLWSAAAQDHELEAALIETAEAWAEECEREVHQDAESIVTAAVERHMPSAEVERPATGPVTAAEVAELIRRQPPPGLTTDELHANELLRKSDEEVPTELGLSDVLRWGQRFGTIPDTYWHAFRKAALELWMRRSAAADYQ